MNVSISSRFYAIFATQTPVEALATIVDSDSCLVIAEANQLPEITPTKKDLRLFTLESEPPYLADLHSQLVAGGISALPLTAQTKKHLLIPHAEHSQASDILNRLGLSTNYV